MLPIIVQTVQNEKVFIQQSFWLLLFYRVSINSHTVAAQSETMPQVKTIFINGDSIHYIDTGKGIPLVLVHGSLGDYRSWQAQIATFSKHYRVR